MKDHRVVRWHNAFRAFVVVVKLNHGAHAMVVQPYPTVGCGLTAPIEPRSNEVEIGNSVRSHGCTTGCEQ